MSFSRSSRLRADWRAVWGELPLALAELVVEQQLDHAEQPVHGRADLVAHVGQELRLGAAGALGALLGLFQQLHLGDVAAGAECACRRSVVRRQAGGVPLDDPDVPVAGQYGVTVGVVEIASLDAGLDLSRVLLGDEVVVPALADDFVLPVSEHLAALLVDQRNDPFVV